MDKYKEIFLNIEKVIDRKQTEIKDLKSEERNIMAAIEAAEKKKTRKKFLIFGPFPPESKQNVISMEIASLKRKLRKKRADMVKKTKNLLDDINKLIEFYEKNRFRLKAMKNKVAYYKELKEKTETGYVRQRQALQAA
ncbi:hypothetical protein GF336_02450 [Candidatus Woesearchaeota archaeon]|nr:hypothetical protein [Candidatus Woesearchaeota archaeon]